jgi:G:T-mismatch repair DNA endonuclease (very short patch repair protein)
MNVQDAAIQISKDAGKPLHAKEIAERIVEAGLWSSDSKNVRELEAAGWRVMTVWECELKKADENDLFEKIQEFFLYRINETT